MFLKNTFIFTICFPLILYICDSFELRKFYILDITSTSITFRWDRHWEDVKFQIWYWPFNVTKKLKTVTTYQNKVTLRNLKPGHLHSVWLMGMQAANVTSDYITFQQRTSQ